MQLDDQYSKISRISCTVEDPPNVGQLGKDNTHEMPLNIEDKASSAFESQIARDVASIAFHASNEAPAVHWMILGDSTE